MSARRSSSPANGPRQTEDLRVRVDGNGRIDHPVKLPATAWGRGDVLANEGQGDAARVRVCAAKSRSSVAAVVAKP